MPSSTGCVVTFDPASLTARLAELESELNKPDFWNDQQRAAKLSAEHQRAQQKLQRYDELVSNVEFLQRGRRHVLGRGARADAAPGPGRAVAPAGGRALLRRVRRWRRGRHDPVRRRRHRRAGLGRDPPAHVPPLGRAARPQDRGDRPEPGGGVRDQVRDDDDARRERVRDPQGRARQASARPPEPVRLGAPPAHELRAGHRRAAPRRRRRDRDRRRRHPHRHVPVVGRRRPARQQDRLRRAHHAHAERHRRLRARTSGASRRTRRPRSRSSARASPRRPRRSARPSSRASAAA